MALSRAQAAVRADPTHQPARALRIALLREEGRTDALAEALAEKVERGELREEHALRIGRQIMRDNALKLFPKLRRLLWKETSDLISE